MTDHGSEKPLREESATGAHSTLDDLLASYVDRLNRGEMLDRTEIEREHPAVARALIERLEVFEAFGAERDSELGTIGDYKLLREVGRGGMGVVYEAWQTSMNRRVALKVLPGGFAADSRAVARFVREAQVAGQLHHPNVASVYGLGLEDDTPFYSMEFVEGETLAELLERLQWSAKRPSDAERHEVFTTMSEILGDRNATSSPSKAGRESGGRGGAFPATSRTDTDPSGALYFHALAESFAAVADGLEHAHQQGVIHRDIKPSNLIVDRTGQIRILDFGLARIEGEESITATGDFLGTVMYVSPEQAMTRRAPLDHRTDIYSLGATLYQMLTWQPPFKGKTHQDTLSQIIFRDPPAPRRAYSRVPRDLETIVLKCLRKNPRDRYGTAEALAQDLRRFVRGEPIEARPQSRWEKAARAVWRHKIRIAAMLVLLGLAAVVAYFATRPGEPRDRRVWTLPAAWDAQAISPDGRHLSYEREGALWVRGLTEGTEGEGDPVETPEGRVRASTFSPDSRRLAYELAKEDGSSELWVAALNGSGARALYSHPGRCQPCSWSGAVQRILVLLWDGDCLRELGLVSEDDGSIQVVKLREIDEEACRRWAKAEIAKALFSPDGRHIAYGLGGDIFLLWEETGWNEPRKIAPDPAADHLVGWAPGGQGVIFSSNRRGPWQRRWDLWLADLEGDLRVLVPAWAVRRHLGCTADGRLFYGTIWTSPPDAVYVATVDPKSGDVIDPPARLHPGRSGEGGVLGWLGGGRYLAYETGWNIYRRASPNVDPNPRIRIYDFETGNVREITPQARGISWLCPSPDGKRFAACASVPSDESSERGIVAIDAQSGEAAILRSGEVSQPQWFPDGKSILFCEAADTAKEYSEDTYDLWGARILKRELDSGTETELARAASVEGIHPLSIRIALSQDGQKLAFTSHDPSDMTGPWGSWLLKVLEIGSERPREIYRGNFLSGLTWTPDGEHVLAGRNLLSYWIPAGGGDAREWELKANSGCFDPQFHPDGRRVAFSAPAEMPTYEIRVLENFLTPARVNLPAEEVPEESKP
jgi:serine/threonine protein kinase/Tol biopolymer transport system component